MIGRSANNEWFVFEAKGRSNELDDGALRAAKAQAEQINEIDNVAPSCRIASQAFFPAPGLTFTMNDPSTRPSNKQRNLAITPDKFRRDYYRPILELIVGRGANRQIGVAGRRFVVASFEEADLLLGLVEDYADIRVGIEAHSSLSDEGRYSGEYIGKDGVLIRLGMSWRPELMRLQPHQRVR